MVATAVFHEEHAQLIEMMEEVRPILNRDSLSIRPVQTTARRLMDELTKKLKEHLAKEDKDLYPSLLANEDAKIRATAWGYLSGEHSLRRGLDGYCRKWLKNSDATLSDEFIAETIELLDALSIRIEREEKYLFPRIEA